MRRACGDGDDVGSAENGDGRRARRGGAVAELAAGVGAHGPEGAVRSDEERMGSAGDGGDGVWGDEDGGGAVVRRAIAKLSVVVAAPADQLGGIHGDARRRAQTQREGVRHEHLVEAGVGERGVGEGEGGVGRAGNRFAIAIPLEVPRFCACCRGVEGERGAGGRFDRLGDFLDFKSGDDDDRHHAVRGEVVRGVFGREPHGMGGGADRRGVRGGEEGERPCHGRAAAAQDGLRERLTAVDGGG